MNVAKEATSGAASHAALPSRSPETRVVADWDSTVNAKVRNVVMVAGDWLADLTLETAPPHLRATALWYPPAAVRLARLLPGAVGF